MSFINLGFGGGNWGVTFWAGTQLNTDDNKKDKLIAGRVHIRNTVSQNQYGQILIKRFRTIDQHGQISIKKDYTQTVSGQLLIDRLTPNLLYGQIYIYNDLIGSGLYKPVGQNTGTMEIVTLDESGIYKQVGIEKGKY